MFPSPPLLRFKTVSVISWWNQFQLGLCRIFESFSSLFPACSGLSTHSAFYFQLVQDFRIVKRFLSSLFRTYDAFSILFPACLGLLNRLAVSFQLVQDFQIIQQFLSSLFRTEIVDFLYELRLYKGLWNNEKTSF